MLKPFAALCVALLLSACGQTGALYLPDRGKPPAKHKDKPAQTVPTEPPLPAASSDRSTNPKPDAAAPTAPPTSP